LNKSNIKFSIITTTLNSGLYIKKLLESVRKQKYKNFEHIFVDSHSTDNTIKIINSYKKIYNIKLIQKKCSIYEGFNIGISKSNGEYLNFIGSDDIFANPNVLKKINEISLFNKIKIYYGNILFLNRTNATLSRHYNSNTMSLNRFRFGYMPAHSSMFFHKDVFKKLGKYNLRYKIAADFDFCLKCFLNKIDHHYINYIITKNKEGGISNRSLINVLKSNKEIIKILKKNKIYSNYFFIFIKILIKVKTKSYYFFLNLLKKNNINLICKN
jgi:glycosyltransferase